MDHKELFHRVRLLTVQAPTYCVSKLIQKNGQLDSSSDEWIENYSKND
jgi:hypothetical protein